MSKIVLSESPVFSTNMEAMERTTPAYYDEWNIRHKQLLENDQYLHNKVNSIEKQTYEGEDTFSEEKSYAAGDCCIYDNILYQFTTAKEAGAWNPEVVQQTTILTRISELNSRIEDLERRIGGYTFYSPPLTDDEYQAIEHHDPNTIYPIKGDD